MHITCLLLEIDLSREGWYYFDKIKINRTAFCNLFYLFQFYRIKSVTLFTDISLTISNFHNFSMEIKIKKESNNFFSIDVIECCLQLDLLKIHSLSFIHGLYIFFSLCFKFKIYNNCKVVRVNQIIRLLSPSR